MCTNHKQIRIAMIASNLEKNGISTVIMNYCTHLDLSKYVITIIVGEYVDSLFNKICNKLGIQIIVLPRRTQNPLRYYIDLNKALSENEFDIAHVHGSSASIAPELLLARLHQIPIRIAHSHNTTTTNMRVHRMMKPLLNLTYTDAFACGQAAGEWLFANKPFTVIKNGFDVKKFAFNSDNRLRMRQKMNLEGKLVLGHVGRFNYQKNQEFLVQLLQFLRNSDLKVHLMLVGTGKNVSAIKAKVDSLGLTSRVSFVGETNAPEELYSAMDCFIFPSRFEGLPVSLLEAQISGLPCVVSNTVTDEVIIGSSVRMVSLTDSLDAWASLIRTVSPSQRSAFFIENQSKIQEYNITNCVQGLDAKYHELVNQALG